MLNFKIDENLLVDFILSGENEENFHKMDELLKNGLNPNSKFAFDEDSPEKSLVEHFCTTDTLQYIKLLIQYDVDLEIISEDGQTLLHFFLSQVLDAGPSDHTLSIYELILKRTNHLVNNQDNEGRTALMLAAKAGATDIIKLLIENGADISICDRNGNNCLHYCLMDNNAIELLFETIEYLIKVKADYAQKNCLGISPIDLYLKMHPPLSETAFSQSKGCHGALGQLRGG